jgi:hypothetical protein
MNYVAEYFCKSSPWSLQNTSNLNNFVFDVLQLSDDSMKKQILSSLRKNIGNSFYMDFKIYIITKKLDNKLLEFID